MGDLSGELALEAVGGLEFSRTFLQERRPWPTCQSVRKLLALAQRRLPNALRQRALEAGPGSPGS